MALVRIGKVVRAVGLKGHLGIAGSEGALAEIGHLVLRRGGEAQEKKIEEARRQGRLWAVRLEGISDRAAAEALVGSEVLARREDLSEPGEARFLWADLEGLEVTTVAGEVLGRVTGLYETGGVDVLIVNGARGEKLIPLAPYVSVDRDGRRIVVDPPEGLLD